jgi:hypothetical protein
MKYFICPLSDHSRVAGKIHLGIPAERTERIIQVTRPQTAVYETGDHEAFISLPALFQLKDASAPHGLVLKTGCTEKKSPAAIQTVLLTPRIDIDLEIPEEKIHRLPEALSPLFHYLRGVYFDGQNMILILDPEKLKEGMQ